MEGFHDGCSSPRGQFGVEGGPNFNWPQMVRFGELVNSEWQIFLLSYDWSVIMDVSSIDGQIETLRDPYIIQRQDVNVAVIHVTHRSHLKKENSKGTPVK